MVDDIVERLRAGTGDSFRALDWMNEAADEIERLRAVIVPAKPYDCRPGGCGPCTCRDGLCGKRDALEGEKTDD